MVGNYGRCMHERRKNYIDADALLRRIAEGTAAATGEQFFRMLVQTLREVLATRGAWVTEYLPRERALRLTRAGGADGIDAQVIVGAKTDGLVALSELDPVECSRPAPLGAFERIQAGGGDEDEIVVRSELCELALINPLANKTFANCRRGCERQPQIDEGGIGLSICAVQQLCSVAA